MNRTQALRHLIAVTNVDPTRILQQNVCYDCSNSVTFSVSKGYPCGEKFFGTVEEDSFQFHV